MKKRIILYTGVVLVAVISIFLLSPVVASAAEWNMTLEATGQVENVTFGISPEATNGLDPGIDEGAGIPPSDPEVSWTQVAFILEDTPFKTLINRDNMTWTLRVTIYKVATSTISWTSDDVPAFIDITINNTDMRSVSSMELTGNATGSVTYEMPINATYKPWNMTLEATSQVENVTFGISPEATNGLDPGIDEGAGIPPSDPEVSWTQVAFILEDTPFKTLINKDNTTWTLRVTIYKMATSTVSWNSADLPAFLDITINNTVNMRTEDSMELTGNASGSVTYEMPITITSRAVLPAVAASEWTLNLSAVKEAGTPFDVNLTYGINSSATDGFDAEFDVDAEQADAYFEEPIEGHDKLEVDIKAVATLKNWTLRVDVPAGETAKYLTWAKDDIPPNVEMIMQGLNALDPSVTTTDPIDMKTEDEITVPASILAGMYPNLYVINTTTYASPELVSCVIAPTPPVVQGTNVSIDCLFSESVNYTISIENAAGGLVEEIGSGTNEVNPESVWWNTTTGTSAGIYTVKVMMENGTTGWSVYNDTNTIEVTGVAPVYGVNLTVDKTEDTTYQNVNATYTLTVNNTGTVEDTFDLTVDNADGAAVANLSTYSITNLAAGANRTVLLNVTNATAGTFGVNVTANSTGDPSKVGYINTTTTVTEVAAPEIVSYEITNRTISPMNEDGRYDSIDIDIRFSQYVNCTIAIENASGTVKILKQWDNIKNPPAQTWNGTDENNNFVLDGDYTVNITWVNMTTGLGGMNNTETITVDNTPPASITNLAYTNGTTWINWTWTNPAEDFNCTEVYLNGTFQTCTANPYYNATELTPDTEYEIGTRTVDMVGNVNATWVNDTAKTLPVVDTEPPASITNLAMYANGTTWINWTWTNPAEDFNCTEVYLNGTFKTCTANPYYNATELTPDTEYEIGTRTVDMVGNVNATWVNDTARTLPLPDTEPPEVTNPGANPSSIPADGTATSQLNVTVNDPGSGIESVTVDLTAIGGPEAKEMTLIAGTDIYTTTTTAAVGTSGGTYNLRVNATDNAGNYNNMVDITLEVTAVPYRTVPLVYNDNNHGRNHISWTGNETTASSLVTLINTSEGIEGCLPYLSSISYYNTTEGEWKSFVIGFDDPGSVDDFVIPQYRALFIRVGSAAGSTGSFKMPVAP